MVVKDFYLKFNKSQEILLDYTAFSFMENLLKFPLENMVGSKFYIR